MDPQHTDYEKFYKNMSTYSTTLWELLDMQLQMNELIDM